MTDEQIKQNAEIYAIQRSKEFGENYGNCWNAYYFGAHSRDEEMEELKEQLQHRQDAINVLTDELELARNPWTSVKERLPENDTLCAVKLADNEIVIARYFNCGFIINRTKPVTHWMPIPPLSPDEQLIAGLKQMQQDLAEGGTK